MKGSSHATDIFYHPNRKCERDRSVRGAFRFIAEQYAAYDPQSQSSYRCAPEYGLNMLVTFGLINCKSMKNYFMFSAEKFTYWLDFINNILPILPF